MKKVNRKIEYSIYTLLSFFISMVVMWLLFSFIIRNYNLDDFDGIVRFFMIAMSLTPNILIWGDYKDKTN